MFFTRQNSNRQNNMQMTRTIGFIQQNGLRGGSFCHDQLENLNVCGSQ